MDKIELRNSKSFYIKMIIGGLVFAAGGLWLIIGKPQSDFLAAGLGTANEEQLTQIAGWSSLIFFGGGTIVLIKQIVDTAPRIVIDDIGVYDRMIGTVIPWNEIEGAYIKTIGNQPFICLQLSNYEKYAANFPKIGRSTLPINNLMGATPITLGLGGLDVDTNQICELILSKSGRHKKES